MAESGLPGFIVIIVMATVTYGCRLAGFLVMRRVRPSPLVERALAALPGAIVAATVVPLALRSGAAAILATLVGVVVARLARNEFAGLAAGLASAILWRAFISA